MEVLSGVASGMAVTSLSIHLMQSVGTIKTFIRNVKDAPKELERLVDLLERLEAVLGDVRIVMERQSSSQRHHFPAPSMTVFQSLQRCEKTIQPLSDMMKRFESPGRPALVKFKCGVKIGLKAKDIASLKMRIEQDMNYLHATLETNINAILTHVLPALLGSCNVTQTVRANTSIPSDPNIQQTTTLLDQDHAISPRSLPTQISVRTTLVSSFEKFVLYRRNQTGSMRVISITTASGYGEEMLFERTSFFLACRLVRHGFTWTQYRPYGKVLPRLRTFPLVEGFDTAIHTMILEGSLQEFQQVIGSEAVHPFLRTLDGRTLLHVAA